MAETLLGYVDGLTPQGDSPVSVTLTPNPLHPDFECRVYISGHGLEFAEMGYQMVWGYAEDPPEEWERP